MRLLVDRGDGILRLEEYYDNSIPRYAILSHTWGADGEEVLFKDLIEGTGKNKAGYKKIEFCRRQAVKDGIQYFWVDTCCIDKANNTELSEAINSMFHWYEKAYKCYVYLFDVSASGHAAADRSSTTTWKAALRSSKWFTRGWTLQELIAPESVEFFSREGYQLGSKKSLEQEIHEITKIAVEALRGGPLTAFEVEERMSWANDRETNRQEDKAYSLFGIFNVRMWLDYGEGREEAFRRLRKKIGKSSKRKRHQDISHDDDQVTRDNDYVIREQKRRRRYNITDWISSINFAAQQSDIISRRQEGTGVWFTDSPEFLGWLQGSNQTLFCPGIPGAGKTMIAAIAVDHLWTHVQDQAIGVAYIYCNYKTQADQKVATLAATIIRQLIQERPSIADPVAVLYDRHVDRGTRPLLHEILNALQAVLSSYSKVYVVIDALDECLNHDRTHLLTMLRNLQLEGNLSFMATSRFVPEVVQEFRLFPMLEVRARESDVKQFVAGQIYRLPRCVQHDDELQQVIRDGISTAVNGMFLLARLHIDSLLDKTTKKKIVSNLDELPKGSTALDEAYKDAIERIERQLPGHSMLAKSVLSWITYAQRLLTTGELCHALAVEPGDLELDPANIPDVEDMVSVCAGLVTVDEESKIIRLVHYTTQEYFERTRQNWNPRAQQEIATACLTYLGFKTFASGASSSDEDFKDRVAEKIFFEYAATNWAHHTITVQEEVCHLALPFLQNKALVASTSQMLSARGITYSGYSQGFVKQMTGLHLATKFGLVFLLEELLYLVDARLLIKADSPDEHGQTPLTWAAREGHEAVVRLLVDRADVDADSNDRHSRSPLSYAAERGHEAVVKLLVEREDVDVDLKDKRGRSPLSWAAKGENEAVVRLLVERDDVDADSKDRHSRSPLSYAAERGQEAVVKLLVEREDIDVDLKDKRGRSPLSWAVQGKEAVVKLLVEREDVDADLRDDEGRSPLSWAAEGDEVGDEAEAVVKLLVERDDVETDSRDSNGRSPLLYAALFGHEAVVKTLIARDDVEADSEDNRGRTPLSWAAWAGYEAVVKLLVARDHVDADSRDDEGRSPLSWAAEGDEVVDEAEAVVKLLVERDDVETDSRDSNGRSPLSYAAGGGHEVVVKMLVMRDDVAADSEDNSGRTPLWWAAWGGHEAVAKLLRSKHSQITNHT